MQVVGGLVAAASSLFAAFVLTVVLGFALSTCEDEASTPDLAVTALGVALAAAAVPAVVGLGLRFLQAPGRTWFGVAVGWVIAGGGAVLWVSQSARCT